MINKNTFRIMALAAFLTVCCSFAYGQPYWDTTVGNPGVSHPYYSWSIDALQVYDDGAGEMLYAGGNFDDFAGIPGTSLIARWDSASNTWSSVGGGLDDGFVNSIIPFDAGGGPELVVGGSFLGAFGVPGTDNIAKWNGSAWSSLGGNLDGAVWAMTTWDDGGGEMLYVGGGFTTAGGVTANGIAAWDGVQWYSMGSGITGWNEYVGAMMVWDDGSGEKLYVGGRFDTMNGLNTPLIARWDGLTWEQVGDGLINDMYFFGIESMAVYDDGGGDALYVGGYEFHAPGQPVGNVSKWDGRQWSTVGPLHDGRVTSLRVFDDGSGPGLYRTGNAAADLGYFAQLVNGDWEMVGGGITKDPYSSPWPSTSDLCVWDDALYICGFFNRAGGFQGVGGLPCGDIAAWVSSVGTPPYDVVVELTPENPPIVIPSNGGSFDFNIAGTNNELDPVTVDIWTMVTLPNGSEYGPIILVEDFTIPAGTTIDRDRTQDVPAGAPTGMYTYDAYVGVYPDDIWDEDHFDFEKLAVGDGSPVYGWECWGEPFGEATAQSEVIPEKFALISAYPNPFNPATTLSFSLPQADFVTLNVYDVTGALVNELVDGWRQAGTQSVTFDATGLTSGVYFAKVTYDGQAHVQKLMLIK